MSKILAAHQPNFLPYLGFFDKLSKADIFVIRDDVLFIKRDFHNRNKIRVNSNDNQNNPQFTWIGVPVEEKEDYLKNIQIKQGFRGKREWKEQLLHDIKTSYQHSQYFKEHFQTLEKIIQNPGQSLLELNTRLLNFLTNRMEIPLPEIILASELKLKPDNYIKSDPSQDLVDICKKIGADVYLSGNGARDYIDAQLFQKSGIELKFQDFKHPSYQQAFPGFLPNMSALDALFCAGKYPVHENTEKLITSLY